MVSDCFGNWQKLNSYFHSLPALLSWNIWNERNSAIFEAGSPSIQQVVYKTIAATDTYGNQVKYPSVRISKEILPTGIVIAWFDGAAQQGGNLCGAGGKILLNFHSIIHWTLNCGQGTNTKEELMEAWASLISAQRLDINEMWLLGDSKVIIDWLNEKADLQAATLECWKERTIKASRHIKSLSFSHIYREDNRDVDTSSKQGLSMPLGHLRYSQ